MNDVNPATSQKELIYLAKTLNVIVLFCSLIILLLLTVETLKLPLPFSQTTYFNIQLIVCIIYLIDYLFLFYLSKNRRKYLLSHFVLLLVSIPYYNIVHWLDIPITPAQGMLLRAVLFIRAGYGLVIMINWFTKSKVTNMMITYLVMLIATAYFGSLVFYSIEMGLNPGLHHFDDALWWACMDVTTVGCAIEPVTQSGRVLAVILAVMGMSMFPILTVYITNYFQNNYSPQRNNTTVDTSSTN